MMEHLSIGSFSLPFQLAVALLISLVMTFILTEKRGIGRQEKVIWRPFDRWLWPVLGLTVPLLLVGIANAFPIPAQLGPLFFTVASITAVLAVALMAQVPGGKSALFLLIVVILIATVAIPDFYQSNGLAETMVSGYGVIMNLVPSGPGDGLQGLTNLIKGLEALP